MVETKEQNQFGSDLYDLKHRVQNFISMVFTQKLLLWQL